MGGLRHIEPAAAERVRSLCEALVPGSAAVAPEVYVDALVGELPEAERPAALADLDQVAAAAARGELGALAGTPAFERARAMAIEAYYSDFIAPRAPGPGAYERIGFTFPLAAMVRKDWSFMGIDGEEG
ncbi:MAG: hypothetical protein QM729_08380 [Solirubrobacterales bacterium]